jgi:hypothetical protein
MRGGDRNTTNPSAATGVATPSAGGGGTTPSPQVKVSRALSELASCACVVGGVALAASKLSPALTATIRYY